MRYATVATLMLGSATIAWQAQATVKPIHRFTKVSEGIYGAIGTGAMNVGSNSAVIVNANDVLVVDSHITPDSARALVREVGALTDKPVRYLVNTHFHFDHAHGNQIFPDDILVIGSEFTRAKLAGAPLEEPSFKTFTGMVPDQITALRKQAGAETDPSKKKDLEERLAVTTAYGDALKEVRPQPPNVTVRNKMTLYRSGREIQIFYVGRGHTGGDLVVYLPKEKVLCSGDLFIGSLGFMGDGYVDEWIASLEELKKLDFETVIPGHGEVLLGGAMAKERIGFVQAYLRDLWSQAKTMKERGISAGDAAKQIDLTAHKAHFPQITGVGADARAVSRIYDVLGGTAK